MSNISYICVSGFFSSGSSAVVDLLREFSGTYECRAEIRLIKDPHGISQLESALIDNWELINSSAALDEFWELCKKCSRAGGRNPFEPAGLGYSKKINPKFLEETQRYINRLTDFEYKADYYYYKFKKNYFMYIIDRWRWAVEYLSKGKVKTANRKIKNVHFSAPTREDFYNFTKQYFDNLFEPVISKEDKKFVILDQAISPNNPLTFHNYLNNSKLVIVSRDPRDMYIDNILWGVGLDSDLKTESGGLRFAKQQKMLRRTVENDKDILYLNFEDLVIDYEESLKTIMSFLQFEKTNHIMPKKYLIPEESRKNVGVWKKYYNEYKNAIDIIERELNEYCYSEA